MNVRLLTETDAAACVALRRAMLLDVPFAFAADPHTDAGSDPQRVREALRRPGFALIGGFAKQELVSIAGLMREESAKRAHIVWLVSVYTAPHARGRGLAQAVIERAIEHARTWQGVEAIQLSVSDRTPNAQRLYERLGFVAWGTEPDAIRVDGESAAEIHMRLVL